MTTNTNIAKSGARAPNLQFTDTDRAELRRLYAQGHGIFFIAVTMGRSESTIKRWSLRMGLREPAVKRPYTDEDKEIIHQGLKMGISLRNIATTLGRSYNAVQVYVSCMVNASAAKRVADAAAEQQDPKTKAHKFLPPTDDIYTMWCRAMDHVREQDRRMQNERS